MKFPRPPVLAHVGTGVLVALCAMLVPAAMVAPPAQAAPITVPAPPAPPENLALTGTATASSVEPALPGNTAGKAIDGDTGTRWSSTYVDANWLQVELAQPSPIDHVKLTWPNAAARAYTLETSMDGANWTVAKTVNSSDGPGRVDEEQLGIASARFVRMAGQKRWSSYGYSISELEIYATPAPVRPESLNLVPAPAAVATTDAGTFRLTPDSRIVARGAAVAAAKYFAAKARQSTGFALPVHPGKARANDIQITVAPGSSEDKPESYTLQAGAAGLAIAANTASGALDGVQTLRQLFPQWIESTTPVATLWTVPGVVISDYPRYGYRGIQVDVARSFFTVAEIKEQIDHAAAVKLNQLHLHLTDDQGWRIAMDQPAVNPSGIKYTDLANISGETAMTYNDAGALMGTELGHTGFYTKADYQEIVRYAGENGMTVVPEIDMPGHTNAALHAIPQLNSAGSAPTPASGSLTPPSNGAPNVGYSTLDADNPATYEFSRQVLAQLAAMTPGPFLHMGGDESHVTPHAQYVKLVDTIAGQVAGLGKRAIGWNEYAAGDLPPNSVVQYWNGDRQQVANRVLANNAQVILSPAERTYIPQKQDASETAGGTWACGGPCTLRSHYEWNPGTYLPGIGDERVLGVETVQWSEWMRGLDQVESYQYPRTLATAEVGWSLQQNRDYDDFAKRAGQLGGRMELQGISYFHSSGVAWASAAAAPVVVPPAPTGLPGESPVDLGLGNGAGVSDGLAVLHKLPADSWIYVTTHGPGGPKPFAWTEGGWVRTDGNGDAPLARLAGNGARGFTVTVQDPSGRLAGFATFGGNCGRGTVPAQSAGPRKQLD
ncbi:family 20 glycosylhydrolase [Arthrobacter dokdonensis]|uniref:family 20 glycosylhydrolase n=1 Tax=Arthrobacter dokdonellae TaxID=2211210 RepID=UPI001494536E|nr:family 20 glycosylhydrolase [Arthrobacter dokdonellae]